MLDGRLQMQCDSLFGCQIQRLCLKLVNHIRIQNQINHFQYKKYKYMSYRAYIFEGKCANNNNDKENASDLKKGGS